MRLAYLTSFIRLTRPAFLLGAAMLYFLGAAIALADGYSLSLPAFFTGQFMVTAVQLMTHYANEFYDIESDRLNQNRTWCSGGSGILSAGELPAQAAQTAMILFAVTGSAAVLLASLMVPAIWVVGIASLLLAWSYSGPPLALVKTGFGELAASILVAGIVPAAGYAMQSGGAVSPALLAACLPLILVHFAMLIALQLPDQAADEAVGKRTLAVRLGNQAVLTLHHISLLLAFAAMILMALAGWPASQWAWLALPLAVWQWLSLRKPRPLDSNYFWLTIRAVALFVLTTLFWLVGYAFLIYERGLS